MGRSLGRALRELVVLALSMWRRRRRALAAALLLFLLAATADEALCAVAIPPLSLRLERALPRHGVEIERLKERDRARHGRLLLAPPSDAGASAGVVDFPVDGAADPFTVGLYFTRVKLGNPAKEFYVQIDTGSDILWVTCSPCNGCPIASGLNIQLESFNLEVSTTASKISCSDDRCTAALQSAEAVCSSDDSSCGYSFQYGDGSGTSGYYVSDTMHFDVVLGNGQTANSSASIVFGCSNLQSGDLTKADRAVDGIFGFGQHPLSVVSQLSAFKVTPGVFSHCLKGSGNGGGLLVLGEVVEPGIVFTPLVAQQPHYNLNLEGISVNGQKLALDPSLFTTSNTQGTIVDSGTTLAYLADQAFDPVFNAILAAVSPDVKSYVMEGNQCFTTSSSSVDSLFPSVELSFMGGAVLSLKPSEYLLQRTMENPSVWCMGWQRNTGQGVTILGDLVLKDKIFVYDLAGQQIGWANYDCSQAVNVSTSSGTNQYLKTGQLDVSGGLRCRLKLELMAAVATWFLKILIFLLCW